MRRLLLLAILIGGLTLALRADWLTVRVGRIEVQEWMMPLQLDGGMMLWVSEAGGAHVDAEERISRIVEEHCREIPGECAALGISVKPLEAWRASWPHICDSGMCQ